MQLLLDLDQLIAWAQRDAPGPLRVRGIFPRIVGDHDHPLGAVGGDLPRDLRHGEAAFVSLAACHRDGVIEQNLVGDVDLRIDCPAQRQRAGVVVGAVAEVLEDVVARGEMRLADPIGALAAHLRIAVGAAIHELRHEMATNAGIGARARGDHGRTVVRTARAEIGRAHRLLFDLGERGLRAAQLRHRFRQPIVGMKLQQPFADRDSHVVGVERALHGKQPLAGLVALADADGLIRRAVEFLTHLHFDQRTLFLDDDDELEPLCEFAQLAGNERPDAADLEYPEAQCVAARLVDAEVVQRLAHVEIRLAGGDDFDLGIGAPGDDGPIDLVGGEPGDDRVALVLLQARLLFEYAVGGSDVEASRRQHVVRRRDGLDAIERGVDHGGRFDRVLDAFDADP